MLGNAESRTSQQRLPFGTPLILAGQLVRLLEGDPTQPIARVRNKCPLVSYGITEIGVSKVPISQSRLSLQQLDRHKKASV